MTKHTPATPLPWYSTRSAQHARITTAGNTGVVASKLTPENAAYIAHAANAYPRLVADAAQTKAALTSLYLLCADKAFSKSPQVREFAALMQRELGAEGERVSALLTELGE